MYRFISQRLDAMLCAAVTFCLLSPLVTASVTFIASSR
jgi:hypothetical protein